MSAAASADPRTSTSDVNDWVEHVAEATVQHDDAVAYATVRACWTRRSLADLGARLELAALSHAAATPRPTRSR